MIQNAQIAPHFIFVRCLSIAAEQSFGPNSS